MKPTGLIAATLGDALTFGIAVYLAVHVGWAGVLGYLLVRATVRGAVAVKVVKGHV